VDRLTGAAERYSTACIEFGPDRSNGRCSLRRGGPGSLQDSVKQLPLLADSASRRTQPWMGRSEQPEFIEGTTRMVLSPGGAAIPAGEAKPSR